MSKEAWLLALVLVLIGFAVYQMGRPEYGPNNPSDSYRLSYGEAPNGSEILITADEHERIMDEQE